MKNIKFGVICFLIFCMGSVFAQTPSEPIEIKHGLGVYFTQNGKKLNPRQLIAVTKVNAEALKETQKAKINHEASQLFGVPGGFLAGFSLGRAMATGEPNMVLLAIGGGLVAVSIPFSISSSKHAKKGVNIYNQGLTHTDLGKLDFNFGLTQHSIGLNMTF